MIIDDLDCFRTAICPLKAQTVLIVDTNAVVAGALTSQGFKPVAGRGAKRIKPCRSVQLIQLPAGDCPELPRACFSRGFRITAIKNILCPSVGKGPDHTMEYNE